MTKPFIVGIAGGSASGKSTFCDALEASLSGLKVKAVHMDSYFKTAEERPYSEAPVTGNMYVDDNHPLTMDLPGLDKDLTGLMESNLYDVILVEGLLTLWDKNIYNKLDLKLFVECRPDERIIRRLKRNMQWGLSFDEIAGVYLDLVRYRHDEYVEPSKWRADFILNGSRPSEKALLIISGYIKEHYGEMR
jgi:uridine kinase